MLLHQLSSWDRDKLKGRKVLFTVRWGGEERAGTITRISASTVWFGCFCFHHDDITSMREFD